ncbi:flagellar hook protein FlgK [Methylobacterium indicum]|uniref:flagellar hook-associated protein FlgK n=1 Tax=Methylobacterium indicum TaxID=1775910 RepID=UPI000734F0A9|nr:flagellar hook-associated protein FlgK [Methylobacterium indicum]KTS32370.1 flagellar hook protein FlgK [Methylobacterium indicum]KTS40606.1 flagellar hook protein FlgK [Methylobacterium indicum]KTS52887.1 flagellar hook protein FlgK [Methylobacterium indicum]
MGLSLALDSARSALLATSSQIAASARNTAGANDPGYSRKVVSLVSGVGGTTVVVTRASDAALFMRKLAASSGAAERQALLDGITALSKTVGDTSDAGSPAARLGALNAALQAAANRPDDANLARAAVESARDLAASLNAAASAVEQVRSQADQGMADSVSRINDLLGQFETANRAVMRGTAAGQDISDSLDARDRILSQLSEEVGITVSDRSGGDMAIYTDSGVPLYERGARTVSFSPRAGFPSGTQGAAVMVDGVPVTGSTSPMRIASGKLAGFATLRDETAVAYQGQLDAIAGALVDTFQEADTRAATDPAYVGPLAGLFTAGSGAALPASQTGLASRIALNAAVDPQAGGTVTLLRDGGMNGSAYRANPSTDASYSGRLRALTGGLSAARSFDPGPSLRETTTLAGFAADSAGWLEASRKAASTDADYQKTLLGRATEALSNVAGVNGDDETAQILQLQRSYTASAKILTMVDDLLKTLFAAVR